MYSSNPQKPRDSQYPNAGGMASGQTKLELLLDADELLLDADELLLDEPQSGHSPRRRSPTFICVKGLKSISFMQYGKIFPLCYL
jgi:hypothetical protein